MQYCNTLPAGGMESGAYNAERRDRDPPVYRSYGKPMDFVTFSGNNIVNARLPEGADVLYAPPAAQGIEKRAVPTAVERAFREPLGMEPLEHLLSSKSRVLIAFDDNCQPFPETTLPDIRQQSLEVLLPMLYRAGVKKDRIRLVCAVALHRKMKRHELERMVGRRIMKEFYPHQLDNFDAEDRDDIAELEATEQGEPVQVCKGVVESDLVIYVDTVQIPLNGGHKSVAVGLGTYDSISNHHHPRMTVEVPHVMQPDGSLMHDCIERKSRVIQRHARIMVMEAAMNNQLYPWHLRYLGKPPERCNLLEGMLKAVTPLSMKLLPEVARKDDPARHENGVRSHRDQRRHHRGGSSPHAAGDEGAVGDSRTAGIRHDGVRPAGPESVRGGRADQPGAGGQ